MGRYVFDHISPASATTPRHDDDDEDFDNEDDHQSREEGEIIEDDEDEVEGEDEGDDQNNRASFSDQRQNSKASFFGFPRRWRFRQQHQQQPSNEEQRYTLFASSDYNHVSDDDENDENGDENDENVAMKTNNSSHHDHARPFDTTLTNRQQQHGELQETSTHTEQHQQSIHYHIYIPESQSARWLARLNHGHHQQQQYLEDATDTTTRKRRTEVLPSWKWITFLALITHILYWYGPSVPPPSIAWQNTAPTSTATAFNTPAATTTTSTTSSTLSWNDYWHQQGHVVWHVSREWMHLCYHVTYWSLHGLRQDAERYWTTLGPGRRQQQETKHDYGRWRFPNTWELQQGGAISSSSSTNNTIQIVGQDAALQQIERTLNSWQQTSAGKKTSVTLLYVAGGPSVGKQSMAFLLLQELVSRDESSNATIDQDCRDVFADYSGKRQPPHLKSISEENTFKCPLLRVTPDDFRHQVSNSNVDLQKSLSNHVLRHPHSILLLQHVDRYPPGALHELIRHIQQQQTDALTFRSTIVLMTSHVGASTIDTFLRKNVQHRQDYTLNELSVEGDTMLKYEIRQYHQGESGGEQNYVRSMKEVTVIPMMPLDTNAMTDVLENLATRVAEMPSYLTVSAANRILDALEWHQWIHKTNGETLRSWSPDGARPLMQLWEDRVAPSIEAVLQRGDCTSSSISLNGSDDTIRVLDYEFGYERFVVRSCRAQRAEDDSPISAVSTIHGDPLVCGDASHSQCHFYL